jgi:hypothetical protein
MNSSRKRLLGRESFFVLGDEIPARVKTECVVDFLVKLPELRM